MLLILGLGTNLGNKNKNLNQAIDLLKDSIIFTKNTVKFSNIFETEAILKPGSPDEWNISFLNQNLHGDSNLSPNEILEICINIEKTMGKKHNDQVWAPRIIDIDILLYGDLIYNTNNLTIPHKELLNRAWCLKPIIEIDPDLSDPVSGRKLKDIFDSLHSDYVFKKIEGSSK